MAPRIEKTVFISYRRTNLPWALAIFQYLTAHGYDVFFDYTSINSGDFEQVILENIKARAHFIVILTPSALERCEEPGDWLRREIESALAARRNIVPLMFEGFDFGSPSIARHLSGKLAALKQYNALNVPADYFDEAMSRLCSRFLSVPLEAVLHPASKSARAAVKEQQAAAAGAAPVESTQLTAQEWYEKGLRLDNNSDEEIRCYSEAIRLKPDFSEAYNNRGVARKAKGDLEGALEDYDEAIRLKPGDADPYNNRGNARLQKGDLEGAIQDYSAAIRLKANFSEAYYNRGIARKAKNDLAGAIQDYSEAIRIKPDYPAAYNNRGIARKAKGDLEGAIKDYSETIRLRPNGADAYYSRGNARKAKGDLEGAIRDYGDAIRLKPEHAGAYYNRAAVWQDKGDYYSAIDDYQRYLDLGEGIRQGDQKEVEKIIARLSSKLKG